MEKIEAIDLFCGVGGLTSGLRTSGVRVVAGIDVAGACKFPFEANHPKTRFIEQDVALVTGVQLQALWSGAAVRLLAGCAPCQPFSSYTRGRSEDHGKWGMLDQFGRLVQEALPELVTMENVPGLQLKKPFLSFLQTLASCGYQVAYGVLNAADFGVPQHRKRLVLLASRLGPVQLPTPTHAGKANWVSVKDAVGKLPRVQQGCTDSHDAMHRAASLSALNLQRICASRPGGTWRDWPAELVAACHKRPSGKHSAGIYGRMEWGKPAPTMTTLCNGYGNGRFGHPEQDRAITLREAAIFQSFPSGYIFTQPGTAVNTKTVARLIGNAVPPKLAEAVGRAIVCTVVKGWLGASSFGC